MPLNCSLQMASIFNGLAATENVKSHFSQSKANKKTALNKKSDAP